MTDAPVNTHPAPGAEPSTAEGNAPAVSVLMAVHDAGPFLREAVDSVLAQTFRAFEFVIVDDASADGSGRVLDSYADPRIVHLRNERNVGLPRSLQRGLAVARGRYIARLDADDAAEPERLAAQVEYMDSHPEVAVLGTHTTEIDAAGAVIGAFELPDPSHAYIAWELSHRNCIYHPTVMMRADALRAVGGYNPDLRFAQDYDLFTRMVMAGHILAVLPQRLLRYRRSPGQISTRNRAEQWRLGMGVRRRYGEWLLGRPLDTAHLDGMFRVLGWLDLDEVADLPASLRLVREMRDRCRRDCAPATRARIDQVIREALIRQARRYAPVSPAFAASLARTAVLGTGWRGAVDRRFWRVLAGAARRTVRRRLRTREA